MAVAKILMILAISALLARSLACVVMVSFNDLRAAMGQRAVCLLCLAGALQECFDAVDRLSILAPGAIIVGSGKKGNCALGPKIG